MAATAVVMSPPVSVHVVPPLSPPPKFALSQFSDIVVNHFDFNTFRRFRDPIALLKHVRQLQRSTRTATAIWKVL